MIKRYRSYVIDVSLSAGASTPQNSNIAIDSTRDFFVSHIVATSDGAFTARLRDNSRNSMYWNDRPVLNTLMFGTAKLPFTLPVYRRLGAGCLLFYELSDVSGFANTIQIVLHGYEEIKEKELTGNFSTGERHWRTYTLINESVSANAKVVRNIKIDKSPNFVITSILGYATSPLFTIRIADSQNGRFNWSDYPINSPNILGDSQYPFILPTPIFLNQDSIVYFDIEEKSGSANDIEIVLDGYEIQ